MNRYEEIADDMLHRLGKGEWGTPGDQIPTLAQLMELYEVSGVQTVRNAQAVLVDRGVLESRHGRGVFIRRLPSRAETAQADFTQALNDTQRLLVQLQAEWAEMNKPAEVDTDVQLPRRWLWAEWRRCETCGEDQGGSSRGWADPDGFDEDYDPLERHREQGHRVATGPGLFPDKNQDDAAAVEIWWESQANAEEATRALVAGRVEEARAYAGRARRLAAEHNDFGGWLMHVTPHASAVHQLPQIVGSEAFGRPSSQDAPDRHSSPDRV